ncbi:MAG: PHP domain-containing protein [Lachnospiraceae bacterium]|nr:PHP domain-containing protein [Lachnospiraceae bacterium]
MKIEHDFHVHTNLSLCAQQSATLDGYIRKAKEIGLKRIGFSDHFWDEKIEGANGFYRPQNYEHVASLLPEIGKLDEPELKIYFGCETEYDPYHHGVAITEEIAEKFDFILVPNSHTHMMMPKEYYTPYQKHADFMIQAYEEIIDSPVSRYITAMAHPFEAVCCPYDNSILIDLISDDQYKRLFERTAKKGIAFEINVASMHSKTPEQIENCSQIRMFRLAKESGCKFLFGSDAHDLQKHDTYSNADLIADLLDLKESDLASIAVL